MITMYLTDVASACGLTSDDICPLTRKLIAAGHDPATPVLVKRGDITIFDPKPLSFWADRTVVESNSETVRFAKYTPFPRVTGADFRAEGVCRRAGS